MFKKILSFFLVTAIVASLTTNIFAISKTQTPTGPWVVTYDSNQKVFLKNTKTGEELIQAIRMDSNGNTIDINLEEYVNQLNHQIHTSSQQKSIIENSIITPMSYMLYKYVETSTYVGLGSPKKVTPDIIGPATISYGSSATISEAFGATISATFQVKEAIKVGASITPWNKTVSSAAQFGATFPVDSGRTAYVQFVPYLDVSVGNLKGIFMTDFGDIEQIVDYGSSWGATPQKLDNGWADGAYQLIYK